MYTGGRRLASSPGLTQKIGKGAWCQLQNISVCAESAYYATHPNNHVPYVIDSLHSSCASALRNGNGML